ncbi:hypothetical protein GA831_09455 [Bifidobacterium adolescentis]|nr:hypothetical protein GA831_09455 [Bifidobacterium adolescentis]
MAVYDAFEFGQRVAGPAQIREAYDFADGHRGIDLMHDCGDCLHRARDVVGKPVFEAWNILVGSHFCFSLFRGAHSDHMDRSQAAAAFLRHHQPYAADAAEAAAAARASGSGSMAVTHMAAIVISMAAEARPRLDLLAYEACRSIQ